MASSDDEESGIEDNTHKFKVDSTSFLDGVDNYDSALMTNNVNHFIVPLVPIKNRFVRVCVGIIKFRGSGTTKLKIEDNDGNIHSISTHNSNHLPEALPHLPDI